MSERKTDNARGKKRVHTPRVAVCECARFRGEDERKRECLRLCVSETTYRMALSVWVCGRGSRGSDTRQREQQIGGYGECVHVCVRGKREQCVRPKSCHH